MIIQNEAQCNNCKDIIFSRHRHDFVACKCNAIAVDGGMAYLKRVGKPEDIIERSMSLDDKIINECKEAVQSAIKTNRNELGIALALIRVLRDNDLLNLEKFMEGA